MRFAPFVILFALGSADAVIAQTDPATPQVKTAAAPAVAGKARKPRMICEQQDTIGTRLGSKRVCHPAGSTDADDQMRRDLQAVQVNRPLQN